MAAEDLSVVRRSLVPQAHDTWESIAQAMFAQVDLESAVSQLQSWNLHVFMRPAPPAGSPRAGNPILPSDIIFLEPPLADAADTL
ncbi:MAG: hypothetical protein HN856_15440 [Gammaproteobacteria bacterium]|jgi:hypothetical protein|nr:hypothetical protein [Gammaproteobacteria bacterium]MCH1550107.1 hypothetical protein [Pseudomonadales bacterium]